MKIEHCPQCNALTPAEGTVYRSDGKRETLYRCIGHRCGALFSRALSQQSANGVQTYRDGDASAKKILTDC
ncbi:hypothetical protein [Ralstonia solanacearum]|uniref:Uncharacterized protein n=1 Tax=Ralstonia solanacearum TaxID=305 RepID=A0AAD0S7D5_RALSL|nr:hypothetical protein [Ralstonia solanacearum]AXV81114.1 hypothetical protein CJO77_05860 [Ralstonia solanacearum]AXW52256.1 hypothetical protein CJO92_05860 [Ralstonia solanacearum]